MKILIAIFTLISFTQIEAGQKYNPYTGQHETVPDDAKLEYNPYNGRHEWNTGNNNSFSKVPKGGNAGW